MDNTENSNPSLNLEWQPQIIFGKSTIFPISHRFYKRLTDSGWYNLVGSTGKYWRKEVNRSTGFTKRGDAACYITFWCLIMMIARFAWLLTHGISTAAA